MSRREEDLWRVIWLEREYFLHDLTRTQHKALFISRKKNQKSPSEQQARASTIDPAVRSVFSTDQVLMSSVDHPTQLSKEAHYAPVLQYYAGYTKLLWQAWHNNSMWRALFKKSEAAQVKYAMSCQQAVAEYDALSGWFKGLRRLVGQIFGIENKRRIARAFALHNAVAVVAGKLNPSNNTRAQQNAQESMLVPAQEATLTATTVDAAVETQVRPELTPRQWPSVAESETLKQAYDAAQQDKKLVQGLAGTGVVYGVDVGIIHNLRALSDDRTIEERRAQYQQQAATSDQAVQQHPVPAPAGQDQAAADQTESNPPPERAVIMSRADQMVEELCQALRRCVTIRTVDFFTRIDSEVNVDLCQRVCTVFTQEMNGLMQEHRAALQRLGVPNDLAAYDAAAQRIMHAAAHFFNSAFLQDYWQAKNIAQQLFAVLDAACSLLETDARAVVELRSVHTHLLSEAFQQALSSYYGHKETSFNQVFGIYLNVLEEYKQRIRSNTATLPLQSAQDDKQTYAFLCTELKNRFTQVRTEHFATYETAIQLLLKSRHVSYQKILQQAAATLCDEFGANFNYVLSVRESNAACQRLYGLEEKAQADMNLVLRLCNTKNFITRNDDSHESELLADLKSFEKYLKQLASNINECKQFIASYQAWQRAWLAWKDQHERGMKKLSKFKKSDYTDPAKEEARRAQDLERAFKLYEPIDRAYQAIPECPIKPSFHFKFYYYSDYYSEEDKVQYPHLRQEELDRNQFWKDYFNSCEQLDCRAVEVRGHRAHFKWYLVSQVDYEIVYTPINLQDSRLYADYEPCILRLQLNEKGICRQMDEHYLRVVLADLHAVPSQLFSCTGVQESWLRPLERPMQQMMTTIYGRAYLPVWQMYLSTRCSVEDLRYQYYKRFARALPAVTRDDTDQAEEMNRFAQSTGRPEVIVVPAAASSHEAKTTAGAITVYGHTRGDRESAEDIDTQTLKEAQQANSEGAAAVSLVSGASYASAALQGELISSGAIVIYGANQYTAMQPVSDADRAASRSALSPFAHLTADNSAWSLLFKTIVYRSYPPLPECVLQLEPEEDTDSPLLKTDLRYLRPILIKRFELFDALYALQFKLAEIVRDSACIDFNAWVQAVQSNEELRELLRKIEKQYKRFSLTAHSDKVDNIFREHYDADQYACTLERAENIFKKADRFYRDTCEAVKDPHKLSRYILKQYMCSMYSQEEAVVSVLCREWRYMRASFGVGEVEQFKANQALFHRYREEAKQHREERARAEERTRQEREEKERSQERERQERQEKEQAQAQVEVVQQENAELRQETTEEKAKRIKAERRAEKAQRRAEILQKKLEALGVALEESDSEVEVEPEVQAEPQDPQKQAAVTADAVGASAATAGLFARATALQAAGTAAQAATGLPVPGNHTAAGLAEPEEHIVLPESPEDDADVAAATARPASPGSTH